MYIGISFGELLDLKVEVSLLTAQLRRDLNPDHHHLIALVVAIQTVKALPLKPDLVPVLGTSRDPYLLTLPINSIHAYLTPQYCIDYRNLSLHNRIIPLAFELGVALHRHLHDQVSS